MLHRQSESPRAKGKVRRAGKATHKLPSLRLSTISTTSPAQTRPARQCDHVSRASRDARRRTRVPVAARERRVPLVLDERVDAKAPRWCSGCQCLSRSVQEWEEGDGLFMMGLNWAASASRIFLACRSGRASEWVTQRFCLECEQSTTPRTPWNRFRSSRCREGERDASPTWSESGSSSRTLMKTMLSFCRGAGSSVASSGTCYLGNDAALRGQAGDRARGLSDCSRDATRAR